MRNCGGILLDLGTSRRQMESQKVGFPALTRKRGCFKRETPGIRIRMENVDPDLGRPQMCQKSAGNLNYKVKYKKKLKLKIKIMKSH